MLILPYICLWLTIASSLTTKSRILFATGLIIAFTAALITGTMAWNGLLALLLFAGIAQWHFTLRFGLLKGITFILMLISACLFSLHLIPGFYNLLIIKAQQTSPIAKPFTMYLNFDKTSMGFLLLFISQIPLSLGYFFNKKVLYKTLPILFVCIFSLMGAGLLTGFISFDFKIPHFTPIWILNNLLFVCVTEEVLFRGILQQSLTKLASKYNIHYCWPLLISSLSFGLMHFKAGLVFIGLASIAGLFYGYAYQKTQRIEAAILIHFLLNLTHFIFFSYPAKIH